MPSEFDFISWIKSQQKPTRLVQLAAGDDLAVLDWPEDELVLVGVDQVLDGVHFDSSKHDPRAIGVKVMNRNLSDCAAMACLPAAVVVSAALPAGVGIDYAKELYLGIVQAGAPFYCPVVGGDTGSWDGKLALNVSITGRSGGVKPLTRSGARVGDSLYVTGPLGGSLLGRHMLFEPRIFLAREIAKKKRASAMIDISDGLSRDLRQICQASSVGAEIDASAIPIHADAHAAAKSGNRSPLEHALHDGEDHELLFTGPAGLPKEFICIGKIVEGAEIILVEGGLRRQMEVHGWEHKL